MEDEVNEAEKKKKLGDGKAQTMIPQQQPRPQGQPRTQ